MKNQSKVRYRIFQLRSTGIISIMTLIKQDIEKDIAKAKKEEEEAVASYEKLVEDVGIAAYGYLLTSRSVCKSHDHSFCSFVSENSENIGKLVGEL